MNGPLFESSTLRVLALLLSETLCCRCGIAYDQHDHDDHPFRDAADDIPSEERN